MTTKSTLHLAVPALVGAFALSTQAQVTISDFTSTPTGMMGWTAGSSGVTIAPLSSQVMRVRDVNTADAAHWGIASYLFGSAIDITYFGGAFPTLENDSIAITAKQGSGNNADFVFALVDNQNSMMLWSVAKGNFASGTGLMGEYRLPMSQAVTFGTFNKAQVKELQIWRSAEIEDVDPDFLSIYTGNPNLLPTGIGGTSYNWQIDSISAVPEPHEYAMFAGLGLIGFAVYRRYSVKAA